MAKLVCDSPNAAIAFDYFVGKGLTPFQAAGIVGNLQWESSLNPRNDVPDPRKDDPSAHGKGIASWGPPRWRDLLAFAGNRDPWALDTQLDFLWHELPNHGLQQLRASATPEDATVVFQNLFEHPDPPLAHTSERIRLANDALDCLSVRPPSTAKRAGLIAAAAGIGALIVAAGYGAYKLFGAPEPEPEPEPELPPPLPIYRRPL
jgi:hypothetical protein